jgi:hypothetical protein
MIPKTTPLDWADEILDAQTLKQVRDIVRWVEHGNGPLLFDGPGARFAAALVEAACGKKVRVVDASRHTNDRAANQRIAYLLQRIETLPGVVILVTNLRSRLDEAFARRFQSVILFTAPAWSRAKRVRRSVPSKPPRRPSRGRSKAPSRARSRT